MAEVFSRATKGPSDFTVDTWTEMFKVDTNATGALIFGFNVSNITNTHANASVTAAGTIAAATLTVEARIVDYNGKLVHSIIPSRVLEAGGIGVDISNKIVMKPGDILQVRSSGIGAVFYASIISGVQIL